MLWLPILIPAVAGALTFLLGERRTRRRNTVNLIAATAAAAATLSLAGAAFQGTAAQASLPLGPGLQLAVRGDLTGLLFACVVTLLWGVTLVYAIGYMSHDRNRARFFGFFAWCIAAANGVALARDPLSLFVFYEILSLCTYPLVVHSGTPAAIAAGRKYLVYAFSGGAALLAGTAWLVAIAGPVQFTPGGALLAAESHTFALRWVFALMAAGFCVKAALMPLHGWLPSAMVAPAPVSSLLHAVAVVKAGVFGIVRLVNDLFGPELATSLGVAQPLALAAAVTIGVASVIALRQDDLKRRLAYSTVAQLAYITLGTALCTPLAAAGALAHLAHHAVMKITMFFTVGSLGQTLHVKALGTMGGVARRLPLTMASFAVAALALAGVPPLAGFASKWLLAGGAFESGDWWALLMYVLGGALTLGYMVPILLASLRPGAHEPAERWESDPRMLWPIIAVALASVVFGVSASAPWSPARWALAAISPVFGGWTP